MSVTVAVLWDSEVDWQGGEPFSKDYINSSYSAFSRIGAEKGAEIVIGNYSWYSEGGMEKAYRYSDGNWSKIEDVEIDGIFDKFKFDDETVEIKKRMHQQLPVLNSYRLEEVCKDKLLTYEDFPKRVPETVKASQETVRRMLDEYGELVLKPRYDFGGRGVRIIDDIQDFKQEEDLLAQRFVDSGSGIPELGIEGVHDLRVIVVDGVKEASFVRTPDEGLISNVSRGGSMHHVQIEEVPDSVLEIVDEVEKDFSRHGNRVYAVDFIFDEEGEPWVLEMNSKPGLVFYDDEDVRSWKQPLMEKVGSLIEMSD